MRYNELRKLNGLESPDIARVSNAPISGRPDITCVHEGVPSVTLRRRDRPTVPALIHHPQAHACLYDEMAIQRLVSIIF